MATSCVQPLVQAFVVCRKIASSTDANDQSLVGPFSRITALQFPADIPLSAYAHLTDARGRYEMGLRLVDDEGEAVWCGKGSCVMEEDDPLLPQRITFQDQVVRFPRPGRYDLEMMANGTTLAHHAIWARQGKPGR
jgi:hypothetical protein